MGVNSASKSFDVLIAGAGAVGCSIAWHLAKKSRGRLKIGVLDRGPAGAETSAGAAGMLAAQIEAESPGPFFDLAVRSRNRYPALAEELKKISGIDVEYVPGVAAVAYDLPRRSHLKEIYEWQKKAGLDTVWMESSEARERFPLLKPDVLGGLLAPKDGQVSASRLTAAFFESAKKMGVQFIENEPIETPDLKTSSLKNIRVRSGQYTAGQFVFALGPWSGEILKHPCVPVSPVKGQILIFRSDASMNSWQSPVFCGNSGPGDNYGCYFTPKKDGHFFVGATMENRGFDSAPDEKAAAGLSEFACKVFPKLESLPHRGIWAGLRPGTPDKLPILGKLPGNENVLIASGHYRNGILLSAVTGEAMADLILEGKSSVPLDAFSPARFLK